VCMLGIAGHRVHVAYRTPVLGLGVPMIAVQQLRGEGEKMAGRRRRKKYSRMIRIGAFIVAAFLGVLMGVMVGLLLHGKTLKRSEGATHQKGFSIGLSLDSRA
jgi:cytochrome c biogenesis protein CcdA